MKGNNIIHNLIILFIIGLGMCSLCVSYAAADAGTVNNKKPEAVNYVFSKENEDDFKVKLIADTAQEDISDPVLNRNKTSFLEAYMDYNYITLNISGVEAFDLDDFVNGKVSLAIDYRMVEDKNQTGVIAVPGICDLGNIPFFLSREDPYWRIGNNNGTWGIGIPDIPIPKEIYKLLRENLTGFYGYNTIKTYNQGVLKGTVSIGKFLSCSGKTNEINLSSLGLSEKLNQEIISNGEAYSTLEIMANYYFGVPLNLKQEEPSEAVSYDLLKSHLQIQGKITLKTQIKVNHDIEPTQKK